MVNIGFSGPCFTWTHRREMQALIQERTDNFFCKSDLVSVVSRGKGSALHKVPFGSLPNSIGDTSESFK